MFFLKWSLTLTFLNIFLKIDFYKIDGHIFHKPNLATYPTNSIFKKMFYKLIISDFRLILVKKPYWNSAESNWVRLVPSFSGKEILESFLFCMYLGSFTLPLHKAKWVQLKGKTLQVLNNSLFSGVQQNKFLTRPKDLSTTPSAFWPQPLKRPKLFLEEVFF